MIKAPRQLGCLIQMMGLALAILGSGRLQTGHWLHAFLLIMGAILLVFIGGNAYRSGLQGPPRRSRQWIDEEDEDALLCPRCGFTLAPAMDHCPRCGVELEWGEEAEKEATEAAPPEEPEKPATPPSPLTRI